MNRGISVNFSPIGGSWILLIGAVLAVTVLTLMAYSRRLKGSEGRWRWFALTLRMLALLLCLIAALRPTVIMQEKRQANSSIVCLLDLSSSMVIADEVRGQARWDVARESLGKAKEFAKTLPPDLTFVVYGFDSELSQPKEADLSGDAQPKGRETRLGTAMLEAKKAQENTSRRTGRMVIISDFASNNGPDPLEVARQMKGQGVAISTVALGTENAGTGRRDVAIRDIVSSPTVFVKNQHEVRATLLAHGYPNQKLSVELYVEGQDKPVAKTVVQVPDGSDTVPIAGLKYNPQTPGEKLLTLKVAQQEGELFVANNEISTFVTVLSGGLNVLFLQGPTATWDYRYVYRAIGRSPDIQVEGVVIRRPAQGDKGELDDTEFAAGKYNVYVLSDLPAEALTRRQQHLLAETAKKGAGLIMLGGRFSFGDGGWGGTEVGEILPVEVQLGDGQNEPEGGVKFTPTARGLDDFVLQVGANRAETARIWEAMPPILGTNRFGQPRALASILATTPSNPPEPLLMSLDVGQGRVLAYGGDTWIWARATEEGRLAHRKFWRQVIFWLSHKENDGDNHVKLTVHPRRVPVGEKVAVTATARDAKGTAIPNVFFDTKVERDGPTHASQLVELYNQGEESHGAIYAVKGIGVPGNYTVTTIARKESKDGPEIGRDTARFLVYQDDRELENPSADLKLAREIADLTGGEMVPPEQLAAHLKGIDRSSFTEYLSPHEYKVWDNWPFLLIFAALLTLEWWVRKRHGWV
jgi:uncharacterized membrane protein